MSSLVTPQVVVMTSYSATNGDKTVIMADASHWLSQAPHPTGIGDHLTQIIKSVGNGTGHRMNVNKPLLKIQVGSSKEWYCQNSHWANVKPGIVCCTLNPYNEAIYHLRVIAIYHLRAKQSTILELLWLSDHNDVCWIQWFIKTHLSACSMAECVKWHCSMIQHTNTLAEIIITISSINICFKFRRLIHLDIYLTVNGL